MAFRASCPYCGATYTDIAESHFGEVAKCGRCGRAFKAHPITPEATAAALEAQTLKVRFARVAAMVLDGQIIRRVPESVLRSVVAVPIGPMGREVAVAMADPADQVKIDQLRTHLGPVRPMLALPREIKDALAAEFAGEDGSGRTMSVTESRLQELIVSALAEMEKDYDPTIEASPATAQRARAITEGQPARQALDHAFDRALAMGATEVRLLPGPDSQPMIQARAASGLAVLPIEPQCAYGDLLTVVKTDAGANARLHGVEQTGAIPYESGGRDLELFVRVLPGRGTDVVQIRVIEASAMRQRRAVERRAAIDAALASLTATEWPPPSLGIDRSRARNVVVQSIDQQLAGVRLAVAVLGQAVEHGCQEVVLEPHDGSLRVLGRAHSAGSAELPNFEPLVSIPPHGAKQLLHRLMLMAGLDLTDSTNSQQGLFFLLSGGDSHEIRLATVPSESGLHGAIYLPNAETS